MIQMNLYLKWYRDLQDGGGLRITRSPLNPQISSKILPTEHLLNTGRRCQTSKKRSQSPQNEAGQKIKKKKVDKGFCDGHLQPGEESWRRKGFYTPRNPHRRGQGGTTKPQRGTQQQVLGRQNGEEFTAEVIAKQHFAAKKWLSCPWRVRAGCWGSGLGYEGWTPGRGLRLTAMKILWES